jgi:hypothetical protein
MQQGSRCFQTYSASRTGFMSSREGCAMLDRPRRAALAITVVAVVLTAGVAVAAGGVTTPR